MTNLNDFDRSLGDFLSDGPNTAPEAPVIAALAHARTTPRRPDLLGALRPDVMGRRRSAGFTLRPGLALAAMALLAASIGVAVVGSRLSDPSVVPPGPSTPLTSPSPVPSPAFSRDIPLIVAAGDPFTLRVNGTTGELIGAVSGQPGDGASVEFGRVQVAADPADPAVLVVTWTGGPCEDGATLTVDEASRSLAILRQDCLGDSIALDRVVHLQFRGAVDASSWTGTIGLAPAATDPRPPAVTVPPTPSGPTTSGPLEPLGTPAVTPIHVILEDGVGDETSVDVVDESGRLASAVAGPKSSGIGPESFEAANDDPTVIRLAWPGNGCDTVHRLTIDAAVRTVTVDRPRCHGDTLLVQRSLILTFRNPVDASSLNTQLIPGRGGVDMPTWTATAPDAESGIYRLTLADPGYLVDSLEGSFDPERGAAGAGPTGIVLDQVDASRVRLVWLGPACATDFQLTLDQAGDTWTLWSAPCEPKGMVLRMVDVVLRSPRAVETITIEARVGEPRT